MAILTSFLGALFRRDYPAGNPARAVAYAPWDTPTRLRTGITVNDDTATAITAVYRSVQLIASTIASLPLHVFERQEDGTREKVQYDADRYLWARPNPEVSSMVFWETVVGHEVLNGNAYLFVVKNRQGEPLELWPIEPARVTVQRDERGKKVYTIDGAVEMVDFALGGEIVHVTGWGRNGLVGISPIRQMAQALGLIRAAEDYASLIYSQGSAPGGILSTDQAITEPQAEMFRIRWERANGGLARSHKTAVLGNGLKWQSTSIDLEDAQMLATRQFQVAEIARMFGIPEHLLGSHDKQSSWGTGLEVNMRAFVTYTLQPHMIRFEQTISDELLRGERYVKFELGGLLRGTALEQAAVLERYQRMGVYSINDMLTLLDRAPIGPAGDQRLVPLNVGRLGEDGSPMLPARPGEPVTTEA